MEIRRQLVGVDAFSTVICSADQTQVVRLGGKSPYPLGCLSSSFFFFVAPPPFSPSPSFPSSPAFPFSFPFPPLPHLRPGLTLAHSGQELTRRLFLLQPRVELPLPLKCWDHSRHVFPCLSHSYHEGYEIVTWCGSAISEPFIYNFTD